MRFETNALSGECNTVKCAWFVKTTLWPAELFAAFQDSVWCHPYLPGGYYHVFIEILQPQPVVEPLHTPHRQLCWQKQIWKSSFLKCDPSACCSSWKRGPLSLSHVAFQPFSQKKVTPCCPACWLWQVFSGVVEPGEAQSQSQNNGPSCCPALMCIPHSVFRSPFLGETARVTHPILSESTLRVFVAAVWGEWWVCTDMEQGPGGMPRSLFGSCSAAWHQGCVTQQASRT